MGQTSISLNRNCPDFGKFISPAVLHRLNYLAPINLMTGNPAIARSGREAASVTAEQFYYILTQKHNIVSAFLSVMFF
jgi:hypothetical protein